MAPRKKCSFKSAMEGVDIVTDAEILYNF